MFPSLPVDLLFFHLSLPQKVERRFFSFPPTRALRSFPSERFKRRIRVAERPAENWFLGRGSKSGQNEMLAVFRWQTREKVVLEYRVVFSAAWRFSGRFGPKRTDNARGMRLRRITFSRDFHGLMIPAGTFNPSHPFAAIQSNIVRNLLTFCVGAFYKKISEIHRDLC